jgi:hypothetical protein
LRSTFASSRLVRLLGGWAPPDGEASGMDVAERLGLWVNAFDAIGLQAANQPGPAWQRGTAGVTTGRRGWVQPVDEDFQQVRQALAGAIARAAGELDAAATGFAACRQRHLDLQRQMEQAIGALRERVRDALGRGNPALRQLAALDAVFERAIAPHEQALLRRVATLLQRRFEQLRQDAPDAWPAHFARDWRQALDAELELRLEPVAGLIEARSKEAEKQP